jgi:hypothetical protein
MFEHQRGKKFTSIYPLQVLQYAKTVDKKFLNRKNKTFRVRSKKKIEIFIEKYNCKISKGR